MEFAQIEKKAKRDFNNAIAAMAIIPLLVFVYLLVGKIASLDVLAGEIGYIMLAVMGVVLGGILLGRQVLWQLLKQLFDYNRKIISMQEELIEKKRLAAITQTVLTLGHEINNPLFIMQGNLELLGADGENLPEDVKIKLLKVKEGCSRISEVTTKLSQLSKPEMTPVFGNAAIIDLKKSK